MTYLVLAILVVLLGIVLMQLFKKPQTPPAAAGPDLANLKVTDARRGDVLSISGGGDNLSDLDFTVDHCTRFDLGSRRVLLLSGAYHERRVALRVSDGGEDVEVALDNDPRRLTLEDLGLAEEDLAQMDERQNTADSFEFDNKVWLYCRSREVQWRRDDQPQPARFYYWEFREQEGNRLLTIRKPESEPFAVSLFTGIPAGDVTVYRGSTAS